MMTRALLAAVAVLALGATAATARGCNGVVNQLVWGCAAWDNNNGPQYPNWHGPAPQPARPVMPPQGMTRNGVISNDGSSILSTNGSNILSTNGSNLNHH
jgi:hypothetical protein